MRTSADGRKEVKGLRTVSVAGSQKGMVRLGDVRGIQRRIVLARLSSVYDDWEKGVQALSIARMGVDKERLTSCQSPVNLVIVHHA